ncbi:site-specific integrase [Streptomyces sp. YKOK-I1]
MVPLINGADRTLRWFIEDVWGQFDDDRTRPGAPLFPSERENTDGSARRVGDDALRNGLENAVAAHLPSWTDRLTPHVLRHFCASQLYGNGLDLLASSLAIEVIERPGSGRRSWAAKAWKTSRPPGGVEVLVQRGEADVALCRSSFCPPVDTRAYPILPLGDLQNMKAC